MDTIGAVLMSNGRAFKLNLANEGLEAKKKEEEITARKRKAEQDANWERECFPDVDRAWPCADNAIPTILCREPR